MALKILIIDDSADYRRLLTHHVAAKWPDAQVREFDPLVSGRLPDAFAGAGNDIVLLGHPCGGENALDWLARFRSRPRFPPVIFIGSGDEQQVIAAIRGGADDYIGKPSLNHRRLVEAIEAALRDHDSLRRAAAGSPGNEVPEIINRKGYDVVRRLADGEVAAVYLVRDRAAGREVVMKVLRQLPDAGGEAILDRFLQEYELVARLDHPNVVRIHDFGVTDDHAYIAMEYCGGGSLKRRIQAGIDHLEAGRLMHDIAGALGALHTAGILHRDLKPTNVLFRADGSLALIDFGLARKAAQQGEVSGARSISGTPYYISPEQGHGEPVDARGDIYSLGVMLYEMLTGQKPYDGDTAMAVIIKHRQSPVPRLPPALAAWQPLTDRMLAKRPQDRFQDVSELLAFPLPG